MKRLISYLRCWPHVQTRLSLRLACFLFAAIVTDPETRAAEINFSRDIRPILSNRCFKCHGPDESARKAELRLDTREGAVRDLGGYQAINAERPAESELLTRIKSSDDSLRMPPSDSGLHLLPGEIGLLQRWIEAGGPYEVHWAFKPIHRPSPPPQTSEWPRNEIDAFVLASLAAQNIAPSPEASRTTLIRRVYLDVLGLPPSPEDVAKFVEDTAPDAYEQMVNRALASPHYGERWGRHWLDQARYADTNGHTIDSPRSIWPYRDWVIKSFNEDMPFDQFTIEQLAGDLLPDPTRSQLVATGFHRNTLINEEGGTDPEQFRNEAIVDRVNTTGAVWFGLTVGCAQCHAHKFDPISQREYYQLFAFFNTSEDINAAAPVLSLTTAEQQQRLDELDRQIADAKAAVTAFDKSSTASAPAAGGAAPSADNEARKKLLETQTSFEESRKKFAAAIPTTMIVKEQAAPRKTHVLIRGDFLRPTDLVEPGVPAVLPPLTKMDARGTRLDLARWLVDRRNPLTARVTVNRIWAYYFGQGLVETENDFGYQGSPPTHPELLDWLADEFMERAWSLKQLHRTILTSATYRQSSAKRSELEGIDPLNKLLARQKRLRVDAETVRDVGLSVSGLLNAKIGGPSVYPPQPSDVYVFTQRMAEWPTSTAPDRYRRGMYTFFARSAPYPFLTTFDSPDFTSTCTFRRRSNTPLQSLTMANDETMVEFSRALGKRLQEHAQDDEQRIDFAFQLCFARLPRSLEQERLIRYLNQQREGFAAAPKEAKQVVGTEAAEPVAEVAAWTAAARVLINLDEFVTRE